MPFWLGILLKRGFLIFWIFLLFFSEFYCRVEYERISGLKFFSPFLGLSHPVLAKNNAGKRFFDFLNFFAIFFGILLPGRVWTEFETKIFSPFLGLSYPVLPGNNARTRFFNFFCYFFRNFLAGVQYERNSGLKFFSPFLGLSHPILAKNNAGTRFFQIFWIFLQLFFWIFLPGSSKNGIRD